MNNLVDMEGQICLVTGANSGIGNATALGLARLRATVVIVCRDEQRGRAVQAEIVKQSGNKAVDLMIADLATQSAVRQLAETFRAKYSRLHILINNAGLNRSHRSLTVDGIETDRKSVV